MKTTRSPQHGLQTGKKTLQHAVTTALRDYFSTINGDKPAFLHKMVIQETEIALLEFVMTQTGQNQSLTAEYLGLNRGTLRKKLKEYDLL